jgi:hypothetical protein
VFLDSLVKIFKASYILLDQNQKTKQQNKNKNKTNFSSCLLILQVVKFYADKP